MIAQVCLKLATIKGHSKMCSFTVFSFPTLFHILKLTESGRIIIMFESSLVSTDRHEASHVSADPPESLHVSTDPPEPLHVSADLPESLHVSVDLPEPLHVTADHPEPCHVTADHPESCDVLFVTSRDSRSVLRFGGGDASYCIP